MKEGRKEEGGEGEIRRKEAGERCSKEEGIEEGENEGRRHVGGMVRREERLSERKEV